MATLPQNIPELIGSIPATQLVIVPDPATGKLLRTTFGQMKSDIIIALGGLSYLDDIIEVATVADLPQPGQTKKIYSITTGLDANKQFRWGGNVYIEFPQGSGNVAAEAVIRGNNDLVLQANINNEEEIRSAADTELASLITAEVAARNIGYATLDGKVNTRITADAVLNGRILAEINSRISANIALGLRIDHIVSEAITAAYGRALSYVHTQSVPDEIWMIWHNLGIYANVSICDSSNRQVEGDLEYIDLNTIKLTFGAPFGGFAFVS